MSNTFTFNGRSVWAGVVSLLDGQIEETFTYGRCESLDFHHSFIVSEGAVERIGAGESAYFWVMNGKVSGVAGFGGNQTDIPAHIAHQILDQITLREQQEVYA